MALKLRLLDNSLSHGSIELYLRCPNLTATNLGAQQPLSQCPSLLRIDLSGCPKLESIPMLTFADCRHLKSVVFGEHSNITNLGMCSFQECALTSINLPDMLEVVGEMTFMCYSSLKRVVFNKTLKTIGRNAFQDCSVLKSITIPDKLKVIEELAFSCCTSLKRVVCNKNLKTIGESAFQNCPKLEDVQLASRSISFGHCQFSRCDHLIEIAAAVGFPSIPEMCNDGETINFGARVVPYLIDRIERSERKRYVLLAHMRFKNAVHAHDGTEEKVVAAKKHHPHPPSMPHPS